MTEEEMRKEAAAALRQAEEALERARHAMEEAVDAIDVAYGNYVKLLNEQLLLGKEQA